jgi:transposase-like protein
MRLSKDRVVYAQFRPPQRRQQLYRIRFLEREAAPESAMKFGIRLHLAGLSLSDTVSILGRLGVNRHRTTVHQWVDKADLQPTGGADPNHVAVDETVIQLNSEQY